MFLLLMLSFGEGVLTTQLSFWKEGDVDTFTQYLNSINTAIKFTIERELDGKLPMLYTLLYRKPNRSIKVTLFQKPKDTNHNFSFESHHPLQHKVSVIRTFMHGPNSCIAEEEDRISEYNHIKISVKICGNDNAVFTTARSTTRQPSYCNIDDRPHLASIVIPYVRGTSEALRGITVHLKPANTLRFM